MSNLSPQKKSMAQYQESKKDIGIPILKRSQSLKVKSLMIIAMFAQHQVKLPHCWLWAVAASTSTCRKRFKQPSRRTGPNLGVTICENGAFTMHLPSFTPDLWNLWPCSYGKWCKIATEWCFIRANHDVQQWMEWAFPIAFPILFSEMGRSWSIPISRPWRSSETRAIWRAR